MFAKKPILPSDPAARIRHHGEVVHAFHAPEFLDYERGLGWYTAAGAICLAIIAIGVVTQAITFVIAFLLITGVYFLLHHHESGHHEVALTKFGVRIDDDFIPYNQLKEFWVVWDPPYVADLKLAVRRHLNPIVTIHIFGEDPEELRRLLREHIAEAVDRGDTYTERVIRLLRL